MSGDSPSATIEHRDQMLRWITEMRRSIDYAFALEPRVRIPVLMPSGRYDSVFPYESSQLPFFRLLGSPAGQKKQVMFEGGHFLPRPMRVAESTQWLDERFGPVDRSK